METGAVNRAQVREVKLRKEVESRMEMAVPTAVHIHRSEGNKVETQEVPGKKIHPAYLAQLRQALLYCHKGSHRKARAEGPSKKPHLHPRLRVLPSSKQKGQDLVRIQSFISYLKLKTATIKILG